MILRTRNALLDAPREGERQRHRQAGFMVHTFINKKVVELCVVKQTVVTSCVTEAACAVCSPSGGQAETCAARAWGMGPYSPIINKAGMTMMSLQSIK